MSFVNSVENMNKYASIFNYPYLTILGSKDEVVNNKVVLEWHAKTASKDKNLLTLESAHQLHKEPNPIKDLQLQTVFTFIEKRLLNSKLFTKPEKIQQGFLGQRNASKNFKLVKICILAYAAIGLWIAILRQRKTMFLKWPKYLLSILTFKIYPIYMFALKNWLYFI